MTTCAHCDRRIIGKPVVVPVTVDESAESVPYESGTLTFCDDRCKRDFFDRLTDFGREVSRA